MIYTQTMDAALFLVFLGRLLRSTVGKVFLIVDRLRAHRTPEVQAWLALQHERLDRNRTQRFVPGDSPSVPFPFDSVLSR